MEGTPFTVVGTASAVLALSKASWKLGISLSMLGQDTEIVDITIKKLGEAVKALGNECDHLHSVLRDVMRRIETRLLAPFDVEGKLWNCLAVQVEESDRTLKELDMFVKSLIREAASGIDKAQRQRKFDDSRDNIGNTRTNVCRHTDDLRITLLLINIELAQVVPRQADQDLSKEVDQLQHVVDHFGRLLVANPKFELSDAQTTLLLCAREIIAKEKTIQKEYLAGKSVDKDLEAGSKKTGIAEWVSALESIRRDQQPLDLSIMNSTIPSTPSKETSETSTQKVVKGSNASAVSDDSDDDLDTDIAKAALRTGTKAFEAEEWEEADSLLQEALQVLRQLPKQRRVFCDFFDLHYKLAVCAYYRQEPIDAEPALQSVINQSANSDEHRVYTYNTMHLLSILYIRMGQVDRARSECERALQGRRRLLGKRSDASLESTALMAHIYGLLNNRPRLTSYLAMIPEESRDAVVKAVERSLGTNVKQFPESPSLVSRPTFEDSNQTERSRLSTYSAIMSTQRTSHSTESRTIPPSPVTSFQRQSQQSFQSNNSGSENLQLTAVPSFSSIDKTEPRVTEQQTHPRMSPKTGFQSLKSSRLASFWGADARTEATASPVGRPSENYISANQVVNSPLIEASTPGALPGATMSPPTNLLSRKHILDKIGCQPKDRIEESVCEGDNAAFTSLLSKKKDSWRSKFRKNMRPERVTALHFAALFGEIEMARCLLSANFNINEVPFGYTTIHTPLKFAIGARQVDMVQFLIKNGAKPTEPDSWSTLAGQLLNRSWLSKTMSESEKEYVPSRVTAILGLLIAGGWNVNVPFENSGRTVLHQAVTFWSGDYRWDLNLRAIVTLFLCERGANPFQRNVECKTPYDLALASGHQDLLVVLDRNSRKIELDSTEVRPRPAELG